ncbi:MAG: alpha/beta hydrolase family protein [Gammaproteobacteria bacterium]
MIIFLPSDKPAWRVIFGQSDSQQRNALSVNYVNNDSPPTLILHGSADRVVTPRSARSLAARLAQNNSQYRLRIYDGVGHTRIIAALTPTLNFMAPTLDDIRDFMDEHDCKS